MASLYSLLCVTTILLSSVSCNNGESTVPQHKALFVFGDSLFDPGNNPYLNEGTVPTMNWPYGETSPGHPTGRYSDGLVVPDFIAQYAKLRVFDPYLKPGATERLTDGANFASGGARVLSQDNNGRMHLTKQMSYFREAVNILKKQQNETEAKRILSSAVYLFSIGGNDYFRRSQQDPNMTESDQAQYVGMVIANLTNILKELYSLGGRKIAFQNVGALGCTPSSIATTTNGDCVELSLALARRHNRALSVALEELQSKLPGFKYSIFDYYNTIANKVHYPCKYGFKEGKIACCGSGAYREHGCGGGASGTEEFETCSKPSEYVWFDGAHTTEKANRQLAELIWSGSPPTTGPYNVKQLFKSSYATI